MVLVVHVWVLFKQLPVKAACVWWALGSPFMPPLSNHQTPHRVTNYFFCVFFLQPKWIPDRAAKPSCPQWFNFTRPLQWDFSATSGSSMWVTACNYYGNGVGHPLMSHSLQCIIYSTAARRVLPPLGRYSWTWHEGDRNGGEWSHHMFSLVFDLFIAVCFLVLTYMLKFWGLNQNHLFCPYFHVH